MITNDIIVSKLSQLKMYYLEELVEDPINGTYVDCEILDVLNNAIQEYEKGMR
jgi:hypothetical protein